MGHYFPSLYPGEIFYSVCARYLSHLRYTDKKFAKSELLQPYTISIYFPRNITALCDKYQIEIPSIEEIINKHTIFPLLRIFLSKEHAYLNNYKDPSKIWSIPALKSYIDTHKNYRLRFCKDCVIDDRKTYGEGYWHILHQVPWINICYKHSIFLHTPIYPRKNLINNFISLEDTLSKYKIKYLYKVRSILYMLSDTLFIFNEQPTISFDKISNSIRSIILDRGYTRTGISISHKALYNKIIDSYSKQTIDFLYSSKTISKKNVSIMIIQDNITRSRAVAYLVLSHLLGCTLQDIIKNCMNT
ncbi:hypothetical protein Haur_3956 [Herpetosiphon aurantiacus DSM 785]|uniref:TniQ domain-containing protein n=1 Tax=Herpetosiphon aurantiacus (strain ATCC 23779 / DSM 785 / 114-95) TaxID=316274 RepID=A9AV00_HERA2|nr:hypothetical protein Haur_3956 [Herpetosiphon aurantiacus DSM 785]